jgi:hypothetical protein
MNPAVANLPTDTELVRLVAEKVMGWSLSPWQLSEVDGIPVEPPPGILRMGQERAWNPLTSNEDFCAVWDQLVQEGYDVSLFSPCAQHREAWFVRVMKCPDPDQRGVAYCSDHRRALVLAALRAKGSCV